MNVTSYSRLVFIRRYKKELHAHWLLITLSYPICAYLGRALSAVVTTHRKHGAHNREYCSNRQWSSQNQLMVSIPIPSVSSRSTDGSNSSEKSTVNMRSG